jgi:peroxiredoxin
MNLNEEIRQVLSSLAFPDEANRTIADAMVQIEENRVAPGLNVGEQAPRFLLPNPEGEPVSLDERLSQGPVVLTFFRGDWCPICNLQLRALQRALPDIENAGASLIAVSPQALSHALTLTEKAELTFDVLSDVDQTVIRDYRLQFTMPHQVKDIYLGIGALDLGKQNADGSWNLPVPGTFVIDQQGVIRERHVTADFTRRMEPEDVLEALEPLILGAAS